MAKKTIEIEYSPFPSQAAFHRGSERCKCFSGGWGSGKTYAGAREAVKLAIKNPHSDGFVSAPTFPMLSRVTLRAFREALPKGLIRKESKGERFIELHNRSRIYYGSTDRPNTLEGSNLSWAWLDEARFADLQAFEILLGRIRCPNASRLQLILTTTPEMNWIYDEFGKGKKDRGLYIGRTDENTKLDPSFIDNLKATLSPQAYKLYAEGGFVTLSGGVFPDFDMNIHCCEIQHDPSIPVDMAIDFGFRKPAVLFCQTIPKCHQHKAFDCLHVLDELMPDNTPTVRLTSAILKYLRRKGWRGTKCYVDPAGRAKNVVHGISDVDVMEAHGLSCVWTMNPQDRNINNGIELIRSKLKNMHGGSSLFISRHLIENKRGLVRALLMSKYPKLSSGSNEPIKDGLVDHARDCLRYYCVNKFPVTRYLQGLGEQKWSLRE